MISFDKIVNKISKSKESIILLEDICAILDPDFSLKKTLRIKRQVYKIIYQLRAWGVLEEIRKGVYFVQDVENPKSREFIFQERYWSIVKKIILLYTDGKYILGGKKSLQIYLKDMSIPDVLEVYTKDIQKKIQITENNIISFKPIFPNGKNFSSFFKKRKNISVENVPFFLLDLETTLLDSLLITQSNIPEEQFKKFLQTYKNTFKKEEISLRVRQKYITSANRLRHLSQIWGMEKIHEYMLQIIKTSGKNCFLTVKNSNFFRK